MKTLNVILSAGAVAVCLSLTSYADGQTTAALYVDGNSEGTSSAAGTFTAPGTDLLIGAENNQYYVYNGFVGDIADVAYYGQALTQSQITAHASAGASYASTVLSDNPLSFWQFDDASSADGSAAFDSAPGDLSPGIYRNLGGVVAPITFVAGPGTGDNGIQLNGTASGGNGNFIDIPDSSGRLNTLTTFSLEFWEKESPQASETYGRFISHDAPSGGYWVGGSQSGTYPGQPFVGLPGSSTWYAWPPNLADGNWHYVVVTYTFVPEPAMTALCGLGLTAGLVLIRRRHA